jgi:hypothetical protein
MADSWQASKPDASAICAAITRATERENSSAILQGVLGGAAHSSSSSQRRARAPALLAALQADQLVATNNELSILLVCAKHHTVRPCQQTKQWLGEGQQQSDWVSCL